MSNLKKVNRLTDISKLSSDISEMKEQIKKMLVFEPVKKTIPNSSISFYTVNLLVQNDNGTYSPLIVDFDQSYCFGVSESQDPVSKSVNGYSVAISMLDKSQPTDKQKHGIQFINCLSEVIKDYIMSEEGKVNIEKYDIERSELKKINPLYYKREKGKIVEGSIPTFYPKLMYTRKSSNKQEMVHTKFYKDSEPVHPLIYLNTSFKIQPCVKFESIYCGNGKYTLQSKLYEANVFDIDKNTSYERKRLLA